MKELEIANKDLQEKITSREMLVIKPLDKNVIYLFLCSFKDIDLTDQLACQRLVDMFINKIILYDNHCEIYFNTNGDKSKQLKLKKQPDVDSEILFESKKKEQSKLKSSDYSLMAEAEGFASQTLFAITPVSQTIVPSIVWSARCGEIIIISFTRRLPSRSNPSINKKEKHKQQVFVFLFFGGG